MVKPRNGIELAPLSEEAKEYLRLSCRKQAPEDFYFGRLCVRGHDFGLSGFSLRRRDNDSCVECFRLAGQRFYIENPDSYAESQRKYKEANRELLKQRNREYEIRNRDFLRSEGRQKRIKQQQKEWRERNRDSIIQKNRERYWANREPAVYIYIELSDAGVEHSLKKPELYFLGTLCKQGHDFQSTGYSLKYKSAPTCVECVRESNKRGYKTVEPVDSLPYLIDLQLAEYGVEFDLRKPHQFYLGGLCKAGHDFKSTGHSLRYLSSRLCYECEQERYKQWKDANKNN